MMVAWLLPVLCLTSSPPAPAIGIREAVQQIALDLDRGRPNTGRLTIAVTDLPTCRGDVGPRAFRGEKLSTQLSQNPGFS
jgi:hypothetical protein